MVLAFLVSFLIDTRFSSEQWPTVLPAYCAIVVHGVVSSFLDQTQYMLSLSLGSDNVSSASTIGATIICLVVYLLRNLIVSTPLPVNPHMNVTNM